MAKLTKEEIRRKYWARPGVQAVFKDALQPYRGSQVMTIIFMEKSRRAQQEDGKPYVHRIGRIQLRYVDQDGTHEVDANLGEIREYLPVE